MKIENKNLEQASEEALEILQKSEDKAEGVVQAINKVVEAKNADLIAQLKEQSEKAESDAQYAKSLKLRVLSKEEKDFYSKFGDIKQAITASQIDIIPTSIVDRTLEDVKEESGVLSLVTFTPADVKKWILAEKTGTFSWSGLTAALATELSATITTLNIELSKLSAYLVIPKAIKDLSLPFVDKYFTAILKEVMIDGLEDGFLNGNGKDAPIGIYKSITTSVDGVHSDKTVNTITGFSPKQLAPAKKSLSKQGKRKVGKISIVCNPNDNADYVAPALYDREGRLISSYKNIEVIESINNVAGKAALVLSGKYVMGFSGLNIKEYDQTKALDDADVVIAKVYANGRAVDDSIAYIIDVTKLEEYIQTVITRSEVAGA